MLAGFVLAQALATEAPTNFKDQVAEVSGRIELGFKLCAKHVLRDGILSVAHKNQLAELDVQMVETVPQDVRDNSAPLFPDNPLFAKIGTDGSTVFIVTAMDSTACRVVVSDTQAALNARVDFVDRLRATSSWMYDTRRSGTANGYMKDELVIKSGHMITIVNGPQMVRDEGRGIQVFVTVGLIPKAIP
ncbi:MAG: hypothetical protein ACOVNK_05480 [Sphingorhabdus lacus]